MKLLGILDLAKRWNYTKQGVHQKRQNDTSFPQAMAVINKNTLVFNETDIIFYEKQKKELTDINHKYWLQYCKWTHSKNEEL